MSNEDTHTKAPVADWRKSCKPSQYKLSEYIRPDELATRLAQENANAANTLGYAENDAVEAMLENISSKPASE